MAMTTNQPVKPPTPENYLATYKHEHDNYLWNVLKKQDDGKGYSTHLYNGCDAAYSGEEYALHSGHYDMSLKDAKADFAARNARW